MSEEDKRRSDRVVINREFENFEAFVEEYVTNISRTGVFIRTKTPLPAGTRVRLRFSVILTEIEGRRISRVTADGKVTTVAETGGGVFAVGDYEVSGIALDEFGEVLLDDGAPGAAKDVADEENVQKNSRD